MKIAKLSCIEKSVYHERLVQEGLVAFKKEAEQSASSSTYLAHVIRLLISRRSVFRASLTGFPIVINMIGI
jgi:hypothetical protein